MKDCNQNIQKVEDIARQLLFLADKGDLQREDEGCGVLFGIVRDSAYKLRNQAEQEKRIHLQRGNWDEEK